MSTTPLRSVVCGFFSAVLTVLAGCAAPTLPPEYLVATLRAPDAIPGRASVAVRWPIAFTPPAKDLLQDGYEAEMKPVLNLGDEPYAPDAYQRVPEASTYYALELYEYLRAYMGESQVTLEPYVVDIAADGVLHRPVFSNPVPVAIAVDVVEMPDSAFGLHGQFLDTNFRISVAPAFSPATCGLLAGSTYQAGLTSYAPRVYTGNACLEETVRRGAPYTALDVFTKRPYVATGKYKSGLPLTLDAVVAFPPVAPEFEEEYLRKAASRPFSADASEPANAFAANLAKVLANTASQLDRGRLTQPAWVEYVRAYDAELAEKIRAGSTLDAQDAAKERILIRVADAELRWMSSQEAKVARTLLNGEFGVGFRKRRMADKKAFDKVMDQSWVSALSLLSAGVSSGLFVPGAFNPTAFMQGWVASIQESGDAQRRLAEQIEAQLAPTSLMRDAVISIDIAGSASQIVAESRAALREKLVRLYHEQVARP
jgi:hypothetical protein